MASTTTGQDIINQAVTLLKDPSEIHWAQSSLLDYLNDGQRVIARAKPEEYVLYSGMNLVAGAVQDVETAIPAANALTRVDSNASDSSVIHEVDLETLDNFTPAWRQATQSAIAQEWARNPSVPTGFFVNPPSVGSVSVNVEYTATPANLASAASVILLSDEWAPALLDYVMFRALSKDGNTQDPLRAGTYFTAFSSALGVEA